MSFIMTDDGGNNNIVSSSLLSKRRLLMTDDDGNSHRSSSSVHQVLFNDDLLIEILLRLPVISLLFFKSVSKRWLSLITSPAFFSLHVNRFPNIQPPCGFFLQEINDKCEKYFVSLDSRIPAGKKKKSSAFTFGCFGSDASNVRVLQSCNGLVLCIIRTNPRKECVYNPTINMFKMLPQVDGLKFNLVTNQIRLAFDPTKSPHYKVLHCRGLPDLSIQTHIYSSEMGCWIIGHTFPPKWFSGAFDRGIYWNDALHWVYVRNRVRHFKLDVEHPHDATTEHPKTFNRYNYTNKLFESRGCLLLACAADPHPQHLDIYEMRNGYSGWSLKYMVKYEDSIKAFFETWRMSTMEFRFNVLFIVVGEREEESFVVMEVCRKVVKYNLLLKTLQMLCDIDTHLIEFRTFPFIASFARV